MTVGNRVRPEVQALTAYSVPAADSDCKLDAMENPFPWPSAELRQAWLERLSSVAANRYPDPRAPQLRARLRSHLALSAEHALLLGNGSDELIQLIALALARPGATVMAPEPTFVMYHLLATACGMTYHGVPLTEDFALDTAAFRQAMAEHDPAVVFLAWPNNPTGTLWPRRDIEAIIDAAPGLVVIDEAYQPFAGDSFLGDLGRWPHVVVLRTLSKLGLAGLRLGALAGPPDWLDEIDKLRLPYNVNVLTQASADFALAHFDVLAGQAAAICAERDRLAAWLAAWAQLEVFASAANFVLVRWRWGSARAAFDHLLDRGIRVKCLDGSHPQLAQCLRITIGTEDENNALMAALETLLEAEHDRH